MSIAPIHKGILGRKIGNTQFFDKDGMRLAATVVEVGPCSVVQKKNPETDKYACIQLGFIDDRKQNINKPREGHFKKAGVSVKRHLKEFKFCDEVYNALNIGDTVTVDQFQEDDFIDVTADSKGKGFAGVMKMFHFHGRPATHGTHESFRGTGSIGMHQTPGRVVKGRKMPGHMGDERVTMQNLQIVKIEKEKNLIYIAGSVPGGKNSIVIIRDSVKKPSEPYYVKKNEETKPKAE